MPVVSKNTNENSTTLDPMVFYARFPHISEKIFEKLNINSLKKCREVSKSWEESIDNKNIIWKRVVKNKDINKIFQSACNEDHVKLAKMLVENPAKYNIDLNSKDESGKTAFHWVCKKGHSKIAEILVQKSTENILDLNAKDKCKLTPFYYACANGHLVIVEMLVQISGEFNFDLSGEGKFA